MARKVTAGHAALRQSEHGSFDADPLPWELAAIDADGNELYRTEGFATEEEAQADCDAFDEGAAYWVDNIDCEVDHFEPRRR